MPGRFDVPDGSDDQRSGYFVYLTPAQRSDQVPLQPPLFVGVADDPPALQATPELECVAKHIAPRGFKPERLSSLSSFLTRLFKRHFRPAPKSEVGNASCIRQTQVPAFNA